MQKKIDGLSASTLGFLVFARIELLQLNTI